ncbi:peptide-methionine (S)-S-oxide reductase MsrA [Marivirga sp. S37H4]|uniref:Peptide methionine sulfoxide reductase MsrA n=1 Tax=Marivirga aurantiaca TaxID=2802615 RepID=A0A935CCT7_9BACT|nr:peptide-methionine (S)-S-oxide reductase MsrA [Marivirga aurantiaca]MBK6266293.1 peptide-methionine (S)-S-oxide reductase MsrA [Marivirga aurantiaca]
MLKYPFLLLSILVFTSCSGKPVTNEETKEAPAEEAIQVTHKLDTAYFAGGCFWCVEASFEQIKGVEEAISGYSGGTQENPTYKEVSYGKTDHAEAVMVLYNPELISYETLLDIFFTAHDPTQLNRQGPDVGEQYRSAIFYRNPSEKQAAEQKINSLAGNFDKKIVTVLTEFSTFYKAEDYHQDYEKKNPDDRYIVNVSKPKIEKVAEKFSHLLKDKE